MSYSVFNPQVVQGTQPRLSKMKAMADNPYYSPLFALLMPTGKPSTVMPCFPAGSVLPSPAGSALLQLDSGVANTLQRALVASVVLVSLPTCEVDLEAGDGGDESGRTGSLANLFRCNFADWLTWQTFDPPWDKTALTADDYLAAQAMLTLLDALAADFVLGGQVVWGMLFPTDAEVDAKADKLEALIANIRLNISRDVDRKPNDMDGQKAYTVAAHVPAKRMDKGAHSRPIHDQALMTLREPISDAGMGAVNKALAEPFGGRTLLAALFIKLLLGHLGVRIDAQGRPSPASLLICDRALTVLNTVAAQPDQDLAVAAATVAGALRGMKLKSGKDGADVLTLLPERARARLPACFKRDKIHLPEAMVDMASAAFAHAECVTAQTCLSLVKPVSKLAQHTACLMLDMLSSGALGLGAEQFKQLESRVAGLKDGAVDGRLTRIAPDADFRVEVLLPQLQRAFRYFSWMGRVGADTVGQVRDRLHHRIAWPEVPQLTAARRPIRAERTAPTR